MLSAVGPILSAFASDLAGPDHAASAMSFVSAGGLFGQLLARVIGGLIGKFGTIPEIYWMSSGAQVCVSHNSSVGRKMVAAQG